METTRGDDSDITEWALPVGVGAALGLLLVGLAWAARPKTSRYQRGPVVPGGSVMSRYGLRTKQGVTRPHWGVDLRAPVGTDVRSAGAGTVMAVWPDGAVQGYGATVVIKHRDGEGTLYAHMDSIDPAMRVGAAVSAGQRVGAVGCTDSEGGFDCATSHLHFEVLAPRAGDDRAFSSVRGGEDPYPQRMDPEAWARYVGMTLA